MDTEIKNITLAFCCRQDWNQFASIDEQTRFCGACKHNVVDFTKSTQTEFDSKPNTCGRFKVSQLSESFLKMAAASLIIGISIANSACDNDAPEANIKNAEVIELDSPKLFMMGMPILQERDTMHMIPQIIPDHPTH